MLRCLAVVLLALSSGCATMFSGSTDSMTFDSVPQGASVTVDGNLLGKTPLKVELERRTDSSVAVFKLEGYAPRTVTLTRGITGAAFLNLAFICTTFGATSWGIDAATGKLLSYSPRSYVIELEQAKPSGSGASLEYIIANYQALQAELVQGKGEHFAGLCALKGLDANACEGFYLTLALQAESLIRQPHALAWYRATSALEARTALRRSSLRAAR